MKRKVRSKGSRGISPVISEIIITACVLTIGASIWNYSLGASSIISGDYVNGIHDQMYVAMERFTIEHVAYMNTTKVLRVWVYNYGGVDIVVDVYAFEGELAWSKLGNSVALSSIQEIDIPLNVANGTLLAVKAYSRRGNNAYAEYLVP